MYVLDTDQKIRACPVKPKHVKTDKYHIGAFGDHFPTETSAFFLVKLAQKKRGWKPFTLNEIEQFCLKFNNNEFKFNRLLGKWIVEQNGKLYFTLEFVARVWESSPNIV